MGLIFMYEIEIDYDANEADKSIICEGLVASSMSVIGEKDKSFSVLLKDGNSIIRGGILAGFDSESVYIDTLWVDEKSRDQGYGTKLLNAAENEAYKLGCHYSTVDTYSFQAEGFYLKNGYERIGEVKNYWLHHSKIFLRKTLNKLSNSNPINHNKFVARTGVYGVVIDEGKMLAVRQNGGPYAGKFDFPGGGIEFGESAEIALRREFAEEVEMEFDSIQLIDNLTATVDVPKTPSSEPYLFFQIGMIYRVNGCRWIKDEKQGDLQRVWIEPEDLSQEKCSLLLWQFVKNHLPNIIKENISIIPYDPSIHEEPVIRKLMSYSLYSAEEEKLNRILKAYSSKEQHLFLCFIDHKLIGLIGFDLGGTILHIAVDPAFRCKGIAREMIDKNSKRFLEIKAETDKEGIGFYKACGFKVENLGEVYPRTERFKCTKQVGKSLRGEFCEFTD